MAATLALTGCLVTDPVEFIEEENAAPVIVEAFHEASRIPLGSVLLADNPVGLAGNGTGGAGGSISNELKLRLHIRDANVLQTLRARVRLLKPDSIISYPCPEPEILPTESEDRYFEFTIDKTALDISRCHTIEIAVSSRFTRCYPTTDPGNIDLANLVFTETEEPDDLAYASFSIWETSKNPLSNPETAQFLANSCRTVDLSTQETQMLPPAM